MNKDFEDDYEEDYYEDESDEIEYVEMRLVDINGNLKGMTVPLDIPVIDIDEIKDDERILQGVNVDGSSLPGFAGVQNSDLHLEPDMGTLVPLSYQDTRKAAVLCYLYHRDGENKNKPYLGDSRSLLKHTINKYLKDLKMTIKPEPEFYLYSSDSLGNIIPEDEAEYISLSPDDAGAEIMMDFVDHLKELGMRIHYFHHEVGPSQQEIEISHDDVMKNVDNLVTMKTAIKKIAENNGFNATFMPKPFEKKAGNGLHIHMRLFDKDKNVFAGENGELSEMGKHFVAGILKHAPAITAIANPSVNSYKRLVPGYEAPVYISWGYRNRSVLLRVPMISDPSKAAIEFRSGDFTTNPYLLLTVLIVAGMDGVKHKLSAPEPISYDIFELTEDELEKEGILSLPTNLGEAISELEKDKLILDALGAHIGPAFLKLKKKEWFEYNNMVVTDFELQRYLNC